jgi:signal transduction histidine kinase
MNINTKHKLATGTALAVIGLIALAIGWAYTEVEDASRQRRQTTEILQRYTELRLVSFDYLRNREERARVQWHAASERINGLIAANHFLEPEHAAILAGLRARRAAAARLFAELDATRVGDFADAALRQRFEAQLISRLLIDQQDSFADAFRLTALANKRIEVAQQRVVMVILTGLALFALTIGSISWFIRRHVLVPIIRLQQVTQEVAAGNLSLSPAIGGDDELGALSRNFDAMTQALRESFAVLELNNRELAAANQELDAFSYSVSHDLRAPLRSIDGFSRVLVEDCSDRLNDECLDAIARIRAASQGMGHLIENLLRLSQVTRASLDVTRVDLSAMAREIAAEIDREAADRAVEWAIEPGLCIEADPALMRIALQNLLQNAWKFTGGTERPVIRVGALQRGASIEYYVADNGAGFDMAFADRLFGAFQRLHRAEEFPGSGIGLAIVKRIIRRHGGDIWAEAKPGEGASFHFSLKESENGKNQQVA